MTKPTPLTCDALITRASGLPGYPGDEALRSVFAAGSSHALALVESLESAAVRAEILAEQLVPSGPLVLRSTWTSNEKNPTTHPMLALFTAFEAERWLQNPTAKDRSKACKLHVGRSKIRLILDVCQAEGGMDALEAWLDETA